MNISNPQLQRMILDAMLRSNLHAFTWQVFATQNASQNDPFINNWHVAAVCHVLEEARLGHASNAVISLPPRHSKSTIAAVAFPAWLLGQDPRCQVLVASHTQPLAKMHSDATRAIMVRWCEEQSHNSLHHQSLISLSVGCSNVDSSL